MNDEQFQKMHQVEVAKLAMLQGIYAVLQSMAIKQGASGGLNWKEVEKTLASASAVAAKLTP